VGTTHAAITGVLLIDKPAGPSSNAVLQRAKRLLGAARAGHTGTLDPLASGLLVIALGEATKFSGGMLDADKSYRAQLRLGERTETGDAEGAVLSRAEVKVTRNELLARLAGTPTLILAGHFVGGTIVRDGDVFLITGPAGQLHQITERLKAKKIAVQTTEIALIPKSTVKVDGKDAKHLLALIEALEEMDDVAKVSSNFDIDAEALAAATA